MLAGFDLNIWQWGALMLAAVLIGMSKTGIQGINTVSIPMLALAFGAKPSTGLILPMLCFADLIEVIYYRRSAEWKYILRLLPTAVAGFFVAILVDRFIPQEEFRRLMGLCILATLGVMFWSDRRGRTGDISGRWWYGPAFGLAGGFTTMIGNAAGPVMAVYLLSMKLSKLSFVGTSAWFFLIVNYLKIPLQVFVWEKYYGIDPVAEPYNRTIHIGGVRSGGMAGKTVPRRVLPEVYHRDGGNFNYSPAHLISEDTFILPQ